MRHITTILSLSLLLTGCLKTPGELKPDDLEWRSLKINEPQMVVYQRLFQGFRTCGPVAPGGYFIGEHECLVIPGQTIKCDIYMADPNYGRSGYAIGLIELAEKDGITTMTAGVLKPWNSQKEKTGNAWFAFAQEEYKACDPLPQPNILNY